MSKRSVLIFVFLCLCLCLPGRGLIGPAQVSDLKPQPNGNPSGLHLDFGSIPLYFTANRGQVDGRALFYAKASRYTLWLTEEGLVFDSFKSERAEAPAAGKEPPLLPEKSEGRGYERDVSRLIFLNASKHPEIVPVAETALTVNYFIGNDPTKWHTAVPTSAAVLYRNIYDRIDLKVYGIESRIEYDWIVRPGGDSRNIKFEYRNVKGTRVDEAGNLLVETGFGELMHKKPAAYQEAGGKLREEGRSGNGSRAAVESAFKKIGENAYGFEVGAYEAGLELVIDPVVLAYSTYLGGSNEDIGYGIAVDGSGNAYVTGQTASANFPALGQYQTDQPGIDVFVTKIDTTKSGTACLIYSTYLGGSSTDEGWAIAVDDSSNAYLAGMTYSANFPTRNQYQTYRGGGAGEEGFVTKLDTTQTGDASLVYSTFLGGSDGGDLGEGIAADGSGYAYVTGYTYSSDFPIKNGYQTTCHGGADVFVTKLDTTSSGTASLVYSTYVGGSSNDDGSKIAADSSGNAYVAGYTSSTNFPTLNQYQTFQGGYDAIVIKIDTTQSGAASLLYSTYLGGSGGDVGFGGIAADDSGNAYVTGVTSSTNFPTLNPYQTTNLGGQDVFLTKLDTTKSGASCLVYSTFLGGSAYDLSHGIAVDVSGYVYVAGSTQSTDFPILHEYQTLQGTCDAFVAKIDPTKSGNDSLVYSTYLGGSSADGGVNIPSGLAVDSRGTAYVTGETWSADFPTMNPYQAYQGGGDAFITLIRASADIAVTKTSDDLTPKVGEEFNFTITATNNGPLGATGLKVTDELPTGLGYVSSTPSQGSYDSETGVWDVGSLAKDAAATLTLKASADSPGEVTNTASVSALNESDPDNSNDSASADVTVLTPCTIETSPSGLSITVDTVSSTAPQTFDWEPGSSHSIGVTSPQTGGTGTQYVYSSWSDAGQQTHTITIPSSATTYTASFTTQYSLTTTANPLQGGTVTPAGTNYYDKDQAVQVQATSKLHYVFTGWSEDLTGTTNPATITVSGPMSVTANFVSGKTLNVPVLSEPLNDATRQPASVTLKWQDTNSSPQEIKYKIRIKKVGAAYTMYTVAANSTSYVISGLAKAKTYSWSVRAIGNDSSIKNSAWPADFKFTTAK